MKVAERQTIMEHGVKRLSNPMHIVLAGLIRCRSCEGVLIPQKGERYYGCYTAKQKECNNKQLISREKIETIILNDLKAKFLRNFSISIDFVEEKFEEMEKVHPGPLDLPKCPFYVAHTSIQTLALLEEEFKGA